MADGSGLGSSRAAASQGLSGAAKTQGALGRKLFRFLVILFILGVLLGSLSLLDPLMSDADQFSKAMFLISALGSLAIGIHFANRSAKLRDDQNTLWSEMAVSALATLAVGLGLVLAHFLFPMVFDQGSSVFVWVIAPAAIAVMFPTLLVWAFKAALELEPRKYAIWYYPKNYREQQHTWNREQIVIANFHFKRKEQEDITTTVNVKLPEDAEFGELTYLFIKDYNENRFPNSPITGLHNDHGTLGWIFRKPRYLLRKQRKWAWTVDILDPKLTIAENKVTRDSDIYFERVFEENPRP